MNLLELLAALAAYLENERLGALATRLITASTDEAFADLHSDDAEVLSPDELVELRTALSAAADSLLDVEAGLSDEVLGHLDVVRQALAATTGEEAARQADAAEREARREQLAAEIAGLVEGATDPDPGEGGEGDEGEGGGEGGEGDEGGEGAAGAEAAPAAEPVPVAAGAAPARRAPALAAVAARRPAGAQPRPAPSAELAPILAAGSFGGFQHGTPLDAAQQIEAWEAAFTSALNWESGRDPVRVTTIRTQFPEDRMLTDESARRNTRLVDAVVSRQAIAASGGIVSPITYSRAMPVLGTTARPVRDALANFGAEATGTIGTMPPPQLGAAEGGVTIWTEANDRLAAPGGSPANPTTKACLRITNPTVEETYVDAIVGCLELGNFGLRYFREHAAAWQELLAVETARIAENKLLDTISDEGVDIDVGQVLDTVRTVFAGIDRATSVYGYRHRDPNIRYRFIAPDRLFSNMRASMVRQMPLGSMDETMMLAEATIARWFAIRNVNVTWHLDGPTGQGFDVQGDGDLQGWASVAQTHLFPEGEWLYLNGGVFNQGVVRDSVLNETNDAQMWGEIFEAAHHHGHDSWNLAFDIVPDGTYAAPVALSIAGTGS